MSDEQSHAKEHLLAELHSIYNRWRMEYRMTYAEFIGVLEVTKAFVVREMMEEFDEEDDD